MAWASEGSRHLRQRAGGPVQPCRWVAVRRGWHGPGLAKPSLGERPEKSPRAFGVDGFHCRLRDRPSAADGEGEALIAGVPSRRLAEPRRTVRFAGPLREPGETNQESPGSWSGQLSGAGR